MIWRIKLQNRILSVFTAAAAAVLSLTSGGVYVHAEDVYTSSADQSGDLEAAEDTTSTEDGTDVVMPSSENDSDEMFEEYVDRLFQTGESLTIQASAARRYVQLSDADKALYNAIYKAACEIADGDRSSSVVTLDMTEGGYAFDDFSLANVIYALLDDYPYEFYWYDKTAGTNSSSRGSVFTVTMPVAAAYSESGTAGTYTVNTELTSAPRAAAARAKEVAAKAYGLDMYDALDYYRQWICDNTSYDYSAPGQDYGDPWQIIYVFDDDASTSVVCEGYAKSFKYLSDCWKEQHTDSELENYLVEGSLGTASHMWNIVHMDDGRNHLADITNCDVSGDSRRLFLVGSTATQQSTYKDVQRTVSYDIPLNGTSYTYSYLRNASISLKMYTEDEIGIASQNYNHDDMTNKFRDVRDESIYYYDDVYDMANLGAVAGTGNYLFSPESKVTRAQFVLFMYRLSGSPSTAGMEEKFNDIAGSFAHDAILWASAQGITTGTGGGHFSPNGMVTREQAATFLWHWCGSPSVSAKENFKDVSDGAYYQIPISWGYSKGIMAGYGSTFGVGDPCTRAQTVVFLNGAYKMMQAAGQDDTTDSGSTDSGSADTGSSDTENSASDSQDSSAAAND